MRTVLLTLVISLLVLPHSTGVPPDTEAINRLPRSENVDQANRRYVAAGRVSIVSLVSAWEKLYVVPISLEWPYGEIGALFLDDADVEFSHDRPLGRVLADISEISRGYVRYERISGILAVVPAIPAPTEDRPLDRVISLDLNEVSTWEALVAVAEAAHSAEPGGRRLVFEPGPAMLGRQPPVGLVLEPSVTIRASNITAREAVCEIIAQSPLELNYFAYHSDATMRDGKVLRLSNVGINFYENGRGGYKVESMSGAEIRYWDDIRSYMVGRRAEKPAPFWKTAAAPQTEVAEEPQPDAVLTAKEETVVEPPEPTPPAPRQPESESPTTGWYLILAATLVVLGGLALFVRRLSK